MKRDNCLDCYWLLSISGTLTCTLIDQPAGSGRKILVTDDMKHAWPSDLKLSRCHGFDPFTKRP